MKLHESGEKYLENILILQRQNGVIRSADLAKAMGMSRPSISRAVHILEKEGCLIISEDGRLELSKLGLDYAEKLHYKRLVLLKYLMFIGVSQAQATADACNIEHKISDITVSQMQKHLREWKQQQALTQVQAQTQAQTKEQAQASKTDVSLPTCLAGPLSLNNLAWAANPKSSKQEQKEFALDEEMVAPNNVPNNATNEEEDLLANAWIFEFNAQTINCKKEETCPFYRLAMQSLKDANLAVAPKIKFDEEN